MKKMLKHNLWVFFFIPKMKINNFLKIYKSRTNKIQTTSFINYLIKKGNYIQTYTKKYNWFEFDDYEDYKNFKKMIFLNYLSDIKKLIVFSFKKNMTIVFLLKINFT